MDIVAWLEQMIEILLSKVAIPQFLKHLILDSIERYITPDMFVMIEKQIACWVCAKAKTMVGPTPTEAEKVSLAFLEAVLGCKDCPPA